MIDGRVATGPVEVAGAGLLAELPHGFLGRRGGVSTGLAAGLNVGLGSGDEPAAVAENRRRAAQAVMPDAPLATVYQVHSPDCVTTDSAWPDSDRPRADALVTSTRGLLLGVVTADCAPILLADTAAGVIGAAHAGWKGAVGGIIESTVAAMEQAGAERGRIVAAIGPTIAQPSYEVDAAFRDRLLALDEANAGHFESGQGNRWQFDLPGYLSSRLRQAGIAAVEALGLDTYAEPERFYSYRRATHRGEPDYGRQIALIGLPG